MDKESMGLMELECLLASAAGESARDALLECFEAAALRLRRALSGGLPPAQFDLACASVAALESARLLLLNHPTAEDLNPQDLMSPFSLGFSNSVFAESSVGTHSNASHKE